MARDEVFKLGADATELYAAADRIAARMLKLNQSFQGVVGSAVKMNDAGKVIGGTFDYIIDSSKKVVVQIEKEIDELGNYTGAWVKTATTVKESTAAVVKGIEAVKKAEADAARQQKIDRAVQNYRTGAATYQRTQVPKRFDLVDSRFVQGALRDIERIVAAGDVGGKRALKIMDDVRAGKRVRLKGEEEDLRRHALRLESARQRLQQRVTQQDAASAGAKNSPAVGSFLKNTFGALKGNDPLKLQSANLRVQTAINAMSASVERGTQRGGVAFDRFKDLVTKSLIGTADPINSAERAVVKYTNRITSEYARANAAVRKDTLGSRAAKRAEAIVVPLKTAIPTTIPSQIQDRAYAQLDTIRRTIEDNPKLKRVDILNAIGLGQKGGPSNLSGAEEKIRAAAARMSVVIQKGNAEVAKAAAATANKADAQRVPGFLNSQFGPINPALDPLKRQSANSRLETLKNSLAEKVERGGVAFTRLQDLAVKAAAGTADPLNAIERNVVRLTNRIIAEHSRANAAINKESTKASQQNIGNSVVNRLKNDLPSNISTNSQERINRELAKINSVISKSSGVSGREARDAFNIGIRPTQIPGTPFGPAGGLSPPGFFSRQIQNVFGTGFFGGGSKNPPPGPAPTLTVDQEKIRQSGARIKKILEDELKSGGGVRPEIDFSRLANAAELLLVGNAVTRIYDGLRAATDQAAKFQRQIALIQTLTQDQFNPNSKGSSDAYAKNFSEEIQKSSQKLGLSVHDVGAAAYDLLSNQVTKGVSDTVATLEVAGVYARTTNSSITDSVNLLSSAINTYNLDAGDAQRVSAQFFTTIDLGRVKTNEMANTFGRVAQFGKSLGVTLEELQASIITITQTGQRTDTTFTLINNVFQKLLNPTKELQKYYNELGVGTGEVFIKTYTFAGALKKLQEEANGSKARLSDFFNEIRAFGGIDALTSRLDHFGDALEKVKNSKSNSQNAAKLTEVTDAQKLAQETAKLDNIFKITFGQKLLELVVNATDKIGGLANVVVVTSGLVGAFGIATTLAFTGSTIAAAAQELAKYGQIQRLILGQTTTLITANQLLFVGAGIAGAAIGVTAALVYNNWIHALDALREYQREQDKQKKTQLPEVYSKQRQEFRETLAEQQSGLLELTSKYVSAFQNIRDAVSSAAEDIRHSMKDSLVTVVASLKDVVSEIENELKDHLKAVNDFDKNGPTNHRDRQSQALFKYRLKDNELNHDNNIDREAALYRGRFKELNQEIARARAAKNYDKVGKLFDERDQLATEQRDKTQHVRGANGKSRTIFRFVGGEEQVRRVTNDRFAQEKEIREERARAASGLVPRVADARNQVREIEDFSERVSKFKSKDENGNFLFGNKEKTLEEFDRLVGLLNKKIVDFRKTAGSRDPLFSKQILDIEQSVASKRIGERRGAIGKEFNAESDLTKAKKSQIDIQQAVDDGNARFLRLTQAAQRAKEIEIDSSGEARARLGHFTENSRLRGEAPFGTRVDPTNSFHQLTTSQNILDKRQAELGIQKDLQAGNFAGAAAGVDELLNIFRKAKELGRTIRGTNGELVTVEKYLNDAKTAALAAANAQGRSKSLNQRAVDQSAQNRTDLDKYSKQLGVDLGAIKANAELKVSTTKVRDSFNELSKVIGSFTGRLKGVAPNAGEDADLKKPLKNAKPVTNLTQPKQIEEANRQAAYRDRRAAALDELEAIDHEAQEAAAKAAAAASEAQAAAANATAQRAAGAVPPTGEPAVTKAYGGMIFSPKGTDTIPAMLTEGEYIMPADMTARYAPILNQMRMGYYAKGGVVTPGNVPYAGGLDFVDKAAKQDKKDRDQTIKQAIDRLKKVQASFPDLNVGLAEGNISNKGMEQTKHDKWFSRGGLVSYYAEGGKVSNAGESELTKNPAAGEGHEYHKGRNYHRHGKGVSEQIVDLKSTPPGQLKFDSQNPEIDPIAALSMQPGAFDTIVNTWSMLRTMKVDGYEKGGFVGGFTPTLSAQNSGFGQSPMASSGGAVNVGDINVNVTSGGTATQTVNEIASGINRGIRRGTISFRGRG